MIQYTWKVTQPPLLKNLRSTWFEYKKYEEKQWVLHLFYTVANFKNSFLMVHEQFCFSQNHIYFKQNQNAQMWFCWINYEYTESDILHMVRLCNVDGHCNVAVINCTINVTTTMYGTQLHMEDDVCLITIWHLSKLLFLRYSVSKVFSIWSNCWPQMTFDLHQNQKSDCTQCDTSTL